MLIEANNSACEARRNASFHLPGISEKFFEWRLAHLPHDQGKNLNSKHWSVGWDSEFGVVSPSSQHRAKTQPTAIISSQFSLHQSSSSTRHAHLTRALANIHPLTARLQCDQAAFLRLFPSFSASDCWYLDLSHRSDRPCHERPRRLRLIPSMPCAVSWALRGRSSRQGRGRTGKRRGSAVLRRGKPSIKSGSTSSTARVPT